MMNNPPPPKPAPSDRDLVRSLVSPMCPGCGGAKIPRRTLCWSCWRELAYDLRGPLYRRVGDGYEDAVRRAIVYLGGAYHLPPETNRP